MGSHGQQPGRSWIPAIARPAGGTDPVDTAGNLRRPGTPDGAGGGGDQGGPHAGGLGHQGDCHNLGLLVAAVQHVKQGLQGRA
eukprot:7548699-Alexandrium_andersonii.AAC.1